MDQKWKCYWSSKKKKKFMLTLAHEQTSGFYFLECYVNRMPINVANGILTRCTYVSVGLMANQKGIGEKL